MTLAKIPTLQSVLECIQIKCLGVYPEKVSVLRVRGRWESGAVSMDGVDERAVLSFLTEGRINQLLMMSFPASDLSQCFLLTPKLLPGLHFTPAITVLQVRSRRHHWPGRAWFLM